MSVRHTIDARGAHCPGPLLELIATLRHSAVGDEIEVLSGDFRSASDIPEWIARVGHALVDSRRHAVGWSIVVRKARG